jgi:Mn2+/Fe2+ NRAMP family transporter
MTASAQRGVSGFWRSFGPGLLWAAAAIGVSHLVQSTRAGADAGLALAGVILLALILKYPFFEYGPRYAAATGESLVEGYERVGRWALWLYFLITISTALVIQAAIVLFTAFLVNYTFNLDLALPVTGALLLVLCGAMLWLGRFPALDWVVKIVLIALAVSTLWAAALTLPRVPFHTAALWPAAELRSGAISFAFILALVGWMPSAIDISVWSSLWTLAKDRASGTRASVRAARLDFLIGYLATGVLAFCFLALGAGVMFRSSTAFSGAGTVFTTQLVSLYETTLGWWMRPVVLVAVVTTMLSTTVTVVDGFPRAIERAVAILFRPDDKRGAPDGGPIYWNAVAILGVVTVVVLAVFVGSLTTMVDFATIVSFVTAPILGYLNLRVVTSRGVPAEHRPGAVMRTLSWIGLVLLGGTAVVFLVRLVG